MNIDSLKDLVVKQAQMKDWNNDTDWLVEKLNEEFKELQFALVYGSTSDEIAEECADMFIVSSQIFENECKGIKLSQAIYDKIIDNHTKKKKTKDRESGKIVRK